MNDILLFCSCVGLCANKNILLTERQVQYWRILLELFYRLQTDLYTYNAFIYNGVPKLLNT